MRMHTATIALTVLARSFRIPFHSSTLMRRVPDPDSPRWTHMALYLHSRDPSKLGIWMEDYKFLAAYKLKASVSYVPLMAVPCRN